MASFPLNTPTQVIKLSGRYFIIDCWGNRIRHSGRWRDPLDKWQFFKGSYPLLHPHSIASDGTLYVSESTESHALVAFVRVEVPNSTASAELITDFVQTQVLKGVGTRPHFTAFSKSLATFYVLGSRSNSLHTFQRTPGTELLETGPVVFFPQDVGYVRSFMLLNGSFALMTATKSRLNLDVYALPDPFSRYSRKASQRKQLHRLRSFTDASLPCRGCVPNGMLLDSTSGVFWVSFYDVLRRRASLGPYLQAYRAFGNFSSRVFPEGPRQLSVPHRPDAPFTPYFMTQFDGLLHIGLIDFRSAIYSWKGLNIQGGTCRFDSVRRLKSQKN